MYDRFNTNNFNTEIFAFIAVLVFKLSSRKVLFNKLKKLETSRLLFKKIANFKGKLLPNYKYLECEFFRILLNVLRDYLSVFFSI